MQPDQFYSRTFRLVIVFTCFKLKKKYKTKNRLKDLLFWQITNLMIHILYSQ